MSQPSNPNSILQSKPVPPKPSCACDCAPPQPWVCNPNEITQNSFISPFGCKKPQEVYDSTSQQCCVCTCDGKPASSSR